METGGGAYAEESELDRLLRHSKDWLVDWGKKHFNLSFDGFSTYQQWQTIVAALITGEALANAIAQVRNEAPQAAWTAFNAIYGSLKFQMGGPGSDRASEGGGYTQYPTIYFKGLMKGVDGIDNVIHELGHAFDQLFGPRWSDRRSEILRKEGDIPDPNSLPLRISEDDTASEIFADMFLEWVRDCTGGGTETMSANMPA